MGTSEKASQVKCDTFGGSHSFAGICDTSVSYPCSVDDLGSCLDASSSQILGSGDELRSRVALSRGGIARSIYVPYVGAAQSIGARLAYIPQSGYISTTEDVFIAGGHVY